MATHDRVSAPPQQPGGAAELAAGVSGLVETAGRRVLLVASGGNIDEDMLRNIISVDVALT